MIQDIVKLQKISTYAGSRVDFTQGGGGNTSMKDEKTGKMAIKASGYKLKDITSTNGYVVVDYFKLKNFLNEVDFSSGIDYDTKNKEVTANSICKIDGMPALRPSVEVGFHAVLKKYVIHTHSMYAGLIVCNKNGEDIAKKLFADKDFGYMFIPYVDPGFTLSVKMKDAINVYLKENGRFPEVIFMQNHGLVVTSDCSERVISLHEEVNKLIKEYFSVEENYEKITLQKIEDNKYVSKTPFIEKYLKEYGFDRELLKTYPLYPDQLVYLNNLVEFNPEKMVIENNEVYYSTNEKEATTLEETLFAYLFIIYTLKKTNSGISTMSEKDVYFINNWEAEKYRRSLSK